MRSTSFLAARHVAFTDSPGSKKRIEGLTHKLLKQRCICDYH